ncbi:MAG: CDP-diacylglycerol--glycerol-3-phosphate 3-phosphatidyltransferase [Planctomycetes bacterium]|nr:CDP-diacylglycerol--glycerol-3-phosphate 3-phosphatidyltransferase [Planctomycetota bacterium]
MNLPNQITLGRFVLALGFFAFFVLADLEHAPQAWKPLVAGAVFGLAVASDALDGYYARKLGLQSDFGRIADPVVDKVIVSGGLILLAACDWARPWLPPWMAVLVIGREFMVNGLRGFIEARGVAFPARWDGKLKMVLQCIVIPLLLLWRALDLALPGEATLLRLLDWTTLACVWLMFVVTMLSGARYVSAAAHVLRTQGDVRRAP